MEKGCRRARALRWRLSRFAAVLEGSPMLLRLFRADYRDGFSMANKRAEKARSGRHRVGRSHTGSGRWTRIEDSWVVEQRVGWCAMRRGGEPWRGLLII